MTGPGVVITTTARAGASGPAVAPSGQAFFVGLTERGDTNAAVLVHNMGEVTRLLGGRPAYGTLYDNLKCFFDEGGSQAYIARIVGDAATSGTMSLDDRAGEETLKVDAASAGDWSSRVSVEVRDGASADTFRITVRLDGEVVEDVNNMRSPAEAVSKFSNSPYVKLTDMASDSTAPDNNPAVVDATDLSAGDDQRAGLAASDYVAALEKFIPGYGDGAVAIPGQTGTTIHQGIIAHCEANRRIGLLAGASGDTKDTLLSTAASYDSDYVGFFAPWIMVSDGGYGTRMISPEGFVAACRSRAHEAAGPHRVPAGAMGVTRGTVLGVQTEFNADDGSELNDGMVSVIRTVQNSIRLYGWRSLSSDFDNWYYLKDRDVLNRLVVEAEQGLEQFVFQPVDPRGKLLAAVNAELRGICEVKVASGALFENIDPITGKVIDPGYKVDTGRNLNSPASLAQGQIVAEMAVRVSPTGGLIILTITKVGLLSGV